MSAGRCLIRHEADAPTEASTCGHRYRLISREDAAENPAAWAHVVEIHGSREHYHRRGTELYYVLEGEGILTLDDEKHLMRPHDYVYVPPGVRHSFSNTGTNGLVFLVVTTPADDEAL